MSYTGLNTTRESYKSYSRIMDNKETNNALIRSDILLHNEEYFKYIFKKTEKIVSAVLYTTRGLGDSLQKDTIVQLVEDKALAVSLLVEKTLSIASHGRVRAFEEFRVGLVVLEEVLTFLTAARLVREDLLEVFRYEINSLHRALREYSQEASRHPFRDPFEVSVRRSEGRQRVERTQKTLAGSTGGAPTIPNRRERILGIIKDKGQVTIKDVSTAITDVSEKTIQRELMSLISEGRIVKEGERRWSKYSLLAV